VAATAVLATVTIWYGWSRSSGDPLGESEGELPPIVSQTLCSPAVEPRGGQMLRSVGTQGTGSFRLEFWNERTQEQISPWHDIPLKPAGRAVGEYTFVCEIPRGTTPKMEINKETEYNPIVQVSESRPGACGGSMVGLQDTKKGKLREYPWESLVNYGAFPQTWEDPSHVEVADVGGDNDPLDVLELGDAACKCGDTYLVKVLGALAMVDGGEVDWKIVTVRSGDPLLESFKDASHPPPAQAVELAKIRDWFRDYKKPDGKPANEFAFGGRYLGPHDALQVVETQHNLWRGLVSKAHAADSVMWWKTKAVQS
jgi:inorganic pyrophosphatase